MESLYSCTRDGRLLQIRLTWRLKKYCGELGITYLSSHKIRFTNASMLFDAGVKAIDIQPLLGHSNLAMTQHYIGQRTTERDSTEMARILA